MLEAGQALSAAQTLRLAEAVALLRAKKAAAMVSTTAFEATTAWVVEVQPLPQARNRLTGGTPRGGVPDARIA